MTTKLATVARLTFAAVVLSLAAWSPAEAAAPVDCSRLTTAQARYWLERGECVVPPSDAPAPTPAPEPPAGPEPTLEECARVDPYVDQALAARCAALPTPPDAVPTFRVGFVYRYGYDELTARVLGVSQDVDGVQVVTVRWLTAPSTVQAFRTPATPGGSSTWSLVGR